MRKERFKITPTVYLILIEGNKILLTRRYNTGYFDGSYSFPAGHLEKDETLKQAITREAKEETDVSLDSLDLKLVHVMYRRIPNDERIDFFFAIKKWQGKPKIMEPDKCDEASWFEFDNLPKNIIPYIKQAIDSFRNNIFYDEREGTED